MLVYVPQGYVALVYEGGRLRDVLEAGVGEVGAGLELQYVYVQPAPVGQPDEELEDDCA